MTILLSISVALLDFLEHSSSRLLPTAFWCWWFFLSLFFLYPKIISIVLVYKALSLLALKMSSYSRLLPLFDNLKPKFSVFLSSGFGHEINDCHLANLSRKLLSDWIIRKLKVSEVYYLIFILNMLIGDLLASNNSLQCILLYSIFMWTTT